MIECSVHDNRIYTVRWSPDDQSLLTAGADSLVKILDAATGEPRRTFQGHKAPVFSACWSPDGRRVLSGSFDQTAIIWDAATGEGRVTLGTYADVIYTVDWSSAGHILLGGMAKNVLLLEAESLRLLQTLVLGRYDCYVAGWSPDGKRVATSGYLGQVTVWDAQNATPVVDVDTGPTTGTALDLAWSPDGTRLLGAGSRLLETTVIWDARTGKRLVFVPGHGTAIPAAAWSPCGTRVLTGGNDSVVRILDAATGQLLLRLPVQRTVGGVAWSPDGKRIAAARSDGTVLVCDLGMGPCDPLAPVLAGSNDTYALFDLYEEQGMEPELLEMLRATRQHLEEQPVSSHSACQ